jgi:hypothetical protein
MLNKLGRRSPDGRERRPFDFGSAQRGATLDGLYASPHLFAEIVKFAL